MWYSQSKVEKWSRRRLAPPFPPWGGGGSGTDTIIVNWQKKNTSSWLEGEEIRQRAWGSPEEGRGPLCSSHESFPFGPKWRCGRRQRHSWGAPSSQTLVSGSLCSREECCKGRRAVGVPVLLWATCEGRKWEASWHHFLVPGPQPFQLPLGTPQSSQCPILCFWKPGPVRFTPSSQDYLSLAPSQSVAVFCDLMVDAQL